MDFHPGSNHESNLFPFVAVDCLKERAETKHVNVWICKGQVSNETCLKGLQSISRQFHMDFDSTDQVNQVEDCSLVHEVFHPVSISLPSLSTIMIRKWPYYFILFSHLALLCLAWEQCSKNLPGGVCPDGNTCCPLTNSTSNDASVGCIPSDMGKYDGTCCENGGGGCPVGYKCRVRNDSTAGAFYYCQASPTAPMADNFTQRLPRYRLCSVDRKQQLSQLHGLEIKSTHGEGKLAYFSSHGVIEDTTPSDIQLVWIVIHGASCNPDDYFCSALAASHAQETYTKEEVLVVAPWFLEEKQSSTEIIDDTFLVWESKQKDSNGAWRYGADSMKHNISSFTALDSLVEIIQRHLGPYIPLVIAGHSSGGQMVNRWSFLTQSSWHDSMKAIVANPSSFLYLTPLRKVHDKWILPNVISTCREYNTWEWGLDDGGNLTVPYRDRALANSSAISSKLKRFRHKRIVYLAGSLDVCTSSSDATIRTHCHSHGLETTCMDNLQGSNRLERSRLHFESLQQVWKESHDHEVVLVHGVGHDHSLMFNSPEGISAVFGVHSTGKGQVEME